MIETVPFPVCQMSLACRCELQQTTKKKHNLTVLFNGVLKNFSNCALQGEFVQKMGKCAKCARQTGCEWQNVT